MSDIPVDNASTPTSVPSSGPADTAPIPTPGAQGASGEPAPDVPGAPSTPPAGAAAEQPKGNDAGDDPADRPKGGFQKRIAELTRRASEAERNTERLLGLLERNAPPPAAGAQPKGDDGDQPPQQSQFKTYEEYLDARADWRADQRVKAALKDSEARTSERQTQETFGARVAQFNTEVAKEGKDIEGFADAHRALLTPAEEGGPEVHPLMADFLMTEAENKALLVKFLGENPDEATKLSKLHPRTMINRLARLDAQVGAKPPAKVSNAPAPPPVLNGSSAPVVNLMDPKTPMDTYAEAWHARRNKR